jgi:uncharacterized membrane protein YidH (DUF202 family)
MEFGFLVEKFDLFLEMSAPSFVGRVVSSSGQRYGSIAGLALIVIKTFVIALAAIRFMTTAKAIDNREEHPSASLRLDLTLPVLLVLLGLSLFVYLTQAMIAAV